MPEGPLRRYRIYVDLLALSCGAAAAVYYAQSRRAAATAPPEDTSRVSGALAMPAQAPLARARTEAALTPPAEEQEAAGAPTRRLRPTAFSTQVGRGLRRGLEAPAVKPVPEGPPTVPMFQRAPIAPDSPALQRPSEAPPEGPGLGGRDPRKVVAAIAAVFVAGYFLLARFLYRGLRLGKENDDPLNLD